MESQSNRQPNTKTKKSLSCIIRFLVFTLSARFIFVQLPFAYLHKEKKWGGGEMGKPMKINRITWLVFLLARMALHSIK